jgi:hypothetical protein
MISSADPRSFQNRLTWLFSLDHRLPESVLLHQFQLASLGGFMARLIPHGYSEDDGYAHNPHCPGKVIVCSLNELDLDDPLSFGLMLEFALSGMCWKRGDGKIQLG